MTWSPEARLASAIARSANARKSSEKAMELNTPEAHKSAQLAHLKALRANTEAGRHLIAQNHKTEADNHNRLRVAAMLKKSNESVDPGTYIGRPVLNADEIIEEAGFSPGGVEENLHVTQLYSSTTVLATQNLEQLIADPVEWGILGPDKALVLHLSCPAMVARFKDLLDSGATVTYPEYKCHMTMMYYGADAQETPLPDYVPTVSLVLGPECVTTLGTEAFGKYNHAHDEHGRFTEADADTIMHQKVGSGTGSIQGGIYRGKDSMERYVKFYNVPKQAVNERVANEVYRALGYKVPATVYFPTKDGKGGIASEMVPNKGVLGNHYSQTEAKEVADGLATDVLLGNRDVLGMGGTNILRNPDGSLTRIDHGGALFYRALGVPKTSEQLDQLQELDGFFNPSYDMGRLLQKSGYKSARDIPSIRAQIDAIEKINKTPKGWEKIIAAANTKQSPAYDEQLAGLLRKRASKLVGWRDEIMKFNPYHDDLGRFTDTIGTAPKGAKLASYTDKDGYTISIVGGVKSSEDAFDRKGTMFVTNPEGKTVQGAYWMGWPEESWGITARQWKAMSWEDRAKLEVKQQATKYRPLYEEFADRVAHPSVRKYNHSHDDKGRFAPGFGNLQGPPLRPWHDHPTSLAGWQAVPGQNFSFTEPKLPITSRKMGAGVIIREPDGRVWIVSPMNFYGGYRNTFPKGTQEDGLTLQQTAIKEAYEESGLKVKITGFFGDYKRDTSVGRYYTAERVGGDPEDHGEETHHVLLVEPDKLHHYVNRSVDHQIAEHINHPPGFPALVRDGLDDIEMPLWDRAIRRIKKAIQKYNHNHYGAGTGHGGQFMPKGVADEILSHVSPGTGPLATAYNKKVWALHEAFKSGDPVAAINALPHYGGKADSGWAKKFNSLKAEALGHAKAASWKPPEPPKEPELLPQQHAVAKWNNGVVKKLTAASKTEEPLQAVSDVSTGKTAKKFVLDYKQALLDHFGKNSGVVQGYSGPEKLLPIPPKSTGLEAGMIGSLQALGAKGDLEGVKLFNVSEWGYPKASKYKFALLTHLQEQQDLSDKQEIEDNILLTPVPADVLPKAPYFNPAYHLGKAKAVEALKEHAIYGDIKAIKNYAVDSADWEVTSYKHALLKYFEKNPPQPEVGTKTLAAALSGKKPKFIMPEPDPIKAGVPEEQVKLYKAKIEQLKAAALSKDPVTALSAIPAGSSSLSKFKNQILEQVYATQATAPKEVGQIVSALKVVAKGEPESWKAFPELKHDDLNEEAYKIRAALPANQKQALSSYQSSGAYSMNSTLRKGGKITSDIKALDEMLETQSFPNNARVIRNIHSVQDLQHSAHTLVGHVVEDPAFMSSSLNGSFGSGAPVALYLNLPKGSKALYLNRGASTDAAYEREVVIARKTRFRIDKVENKAGPYGTTQAKIYATVLPRHQQPKP